MGTAEFGRMVDAAMRAKGYSAGRVAVAIGVLSDGNVWDTTRVQRLRRGQVRHVDRELVDRLIIVLGLDPFDAYEAADLRPSGFTAEDHRDFVGAAQGHAARIGHAAPLNAASNPRPTRDVTYPAPLRRAA